MEPMYELVEVPDLEPTFLEDLLEVPEVDDDYTTDWRAYDV